LGTWQKRVFSILIIVLLVIPALCIFNSQPAFALDEADLSEDLSGIEDYLSQMDSQISEEEEYFSLSGFWQQLKEGNLSLDFKSLLYFFASFFFKEVAASGAFLGQLIILSVICLILTNLKNSFDKGNIATLSNGVVYLVLIGLASGSFSLAVSVATAAMDSMSSFLYALLPLLMTLLAAIGGVTTVSVINPMILAAISLMMFLMKNFIFPLIYFSAVLRLVSNISPNFNVDKMAGLFKDIAIGIMSVCLTVFVAFLSLSGLASASMDGLAVKAAKSATGIFIPVVGKSLADALDSVLGTALVLKNAVGVLGVVVILFICAMPAIKILAQVLIYRLAAAVVQPMGENQLANALSGIASSLLLLFAAVTVCGLLFFFAIVITLGVGNLAMMMR